MKRVLTLLCILLMFSACNYFTKGVPPEYEITLENMVEIKETVKPDPYGINRLRYKVQEGRVRRNESLYTILSDLELSPQQIYEINEKAADTFRSNRVMPGQRYIAYLEQSSSQPVKLVLHQDALNYVVFDWENDIRVSRGMKEVTTRIASTEGVINSSLYESLQDKGNDILLGLSLAEIFAWQIDFFRLYPGDRFRVVYEKEYVDGTYYGLGNILAAEFEHSGERYTAFWYENEERAGYFDADGNSVQKALLKAPFKFSQRISSGYSSNRFHPVLKRPMPHYGVDYAAPLGTPVLAVGDGEIMEAQYRGANGNIVKIRHNSTYTTAYLHLNGFAKGVRRGTRVRQGQVIGYVGKTGRVTGVHLDYRIYKNGSPVNPLTVDLPPSRSIASQELPKFKEHIASYLRSLNEASRPTEAEIMLDITAQ